MGSQTNASPFSLLEFTLPLPTQSLLGFWSSLSTTWHRFLLQSRRKQTTRNWILWWEGMGAISHFSYTCYEPGCECGDLLCVGCKVLMACGLCSMASPTVTVPKALEYDKENSQKKKNRSQKWFFFFFYKFWFYHNNISFTNFVFIILIFTLFYRI